MVMGLLSLVSLATPAYTSAKDLFIYLRKKRKFVQKIEENLQSLRDEVEFVDAFITNIEEEEERNVTSKELNAFGRFVVGKSKEKVEKFKEIETQYETVKSRKSNFFALAKLSKDIKIERMNEVTRLIEKTKMGGFFTRKPPEPFDRIHAEDISDIPSLAEKLRELLKHLEDKDVWSVGIYGPPGIGITAVLQNVNDKLRCLHEDQSNQPLPRNYSSFDMVIRATVGVEKSAISKIQKSIANKLDIIVGDDNEQAASKISEALEKKRYLLLLDEVHSPVDLKAVGITDKHKHGKVVIAASNKDVIKKMKLDQEIPVEKLSDDDAWNLFRGYVGNVADGARIKYIAKLIVRELGGLPLVIKTMGLHLQDVRDEREWNRTRAAVQSYIETDNYELQRLAGVYFVYNQVYNNLSSNVWEIY